MKLTDKNTNIVLSVYARLRKYPQINCQSNDMAAPLATAILNHGKKRLKYLCYLFCLIIPLSAERNRVCRVLCKFHTDLPKN